MSQLIEIQLFLTANFKVPLTLLPLHTSPLLKETWMGITTLCSGARGSFNSAARSTLTSKLYILRKQVLTMK